MAELKTKMNNADVDSFISALPDETKRKDCFALIKIMKEITKELPAMWGSSIVGFGKYHYKYKSGREGDWFLTAFSPRKGSITVYLMPGFKNSEKILTKLGKIKTGKGCLYIKSLSDIDIKILKELIMNSVKELKGMYGS